MPSQSPAELAARPAQRSLVLVQPTGLLVGMALLLGSLLVLINTLKLADSPAPEEAIVIGDTPYDAQAAGKIPVRTVGVLCGGFPEESLTDAGCIAIYKDPADLLARYDDSPLK